MAKSRVPKQLIDYQRQAIAFQKATLDNSYNAMLALQERQQEFFDGLLGQIPNMPDEAQQLVETWREMAAESRRQFKSTVDHSFETLDDYLGRLTEPEDGEAPSATKKRTPKKSGSSK